MRQELDYIDQETAEGLDLVERVIKINRSAKVMKGGRRFGFSALVVLGDGRGIVGLGFGKAREVPPSVEKAVADARKKLVRVSLVGNTFSATVIWRRDEAGGKFYTGTLSVSGTFAGDKIASGGFVNSITDKQADNLGVCEPSSGSWEASKSE